MTEAAPPPDVLVTPPVVVDGSGETATREVVPFLNDDFIRDYTALDPSLLAQACADTNAEMREAPLADRTVHIGVVANFLTQSVDPGHGHHRAALIAAACRLIGNAGFEPPRFSDLQPKKDQEA